VQDALEAVRGELVGEIDQRARTRGGGAGAVAARSRRIAGCYENTVTVMVFS
jgi:hypothetical protein